MKVKISLKNENSSMMNNQVLYKKGVFKTEKKNQEIRC
jgi:hypothetical protein